VFVIKISQRQKHNCLPFEKRIRNNLNTCALSFASSYYRNKIAFATSGLPSQRKMASCGK
jgi:hypothetical protein